MNTLIESDYLEQIRITLESIEDEVENMDEDIDYKTSDGMLTLIFPNGKQLILNRQRAALQLWLATPDQGLHFDYNTSARTWEDDKTKATLDTILSKEFTKLLEREVTLHLSQ